MNFIQQIKVKKDRNIHEKNIDPIEPEIVLFGLIFDIFGPFKILPTK